MESYIYCGNNPINYKDFDGNFKIPANATSAQKKILNSMFVKIRNLFKSTHLRTTFKNAFGINDSDINNMLKDGSGPIVMINDTGSSGKFDPSSPENININSEYMDDLIKNGMQGDVYNLLLRVIIHEGGHWADYNKDGKNVENNMLYKYDDAGDEWEKSFFGKDITGLLNKEDNKRVSDRFNSINRSVEAHQKQLQNIINNYNRKNNQPNTTTTTPQNIIPRIKNDNIRNNNKPVIPKVPVYEPICG